MVKFFFQIVPTLLTSRRPLDDVEASILTSMTSIDIRILGCGAVNQTTLTAPQRRF